MDIKTVLVPTDFSLPSRMAVNYGVALARRFRARLVLAHVLAPLPFESHASETVRSEIEKESREKALVEMSSLLAPEDEDDLDLKMVLKSGGVQEEIAAAAADEHADVVVMGTHGRGRLGRLIIGSTTRSLLRKLSIPILSVSNAIRPMAFKRILFATDLSEHSDRGFNLALDLARTLQAEVVVLNVVSNTDEHARTLAVQESRLRLTPLIAQGRLQKVNVRTVVAHGAAATQILKTAQETDADFILLTLDTKGALERAVLGTTAEDVVKEAEVPVLSVPVNTAANREKLRA